MKKLSTISLFIFGVVVIAILVAGLVFYQDKKNNKVADSSTGVLVADTINQLTASGKNLVLSMEEIGKHSKSSDCWMLIDGKVYNVTSYFGSHPGGNSTMAATCGKDATIAYATKDPNASNNIKGQSHSFNAKNLLTDYYLGYLGQTIGDQSTTISNPIVNTPKTQTNNLLTNNQSPTPPVVKPIILPTENITLNMIEIAKHNTQTDCWFLISGKVYNITSYFGSHPGGNAKMLATCGEDATAEYATKNPSATSSSGGSSHSSGATTMLGNYYLGDLNQTIGGQKITETNTVAAPISNGDDEDEDD